MIKMAPTMDEIMIAANMPASIESDDDLFAFGGFVGVGGLGAGGFGGPGGCGGFGTGRHGAGGCGVGDGAHGGPAPSNTLKIEINRYLWCVLIKIENNIQCLQFRIAK